MIRDAHQPATPDPAPAPVSRRRFAAEHLGRHLDAMSKRVEGVRAAADAEMVHKMRVATRRLRNAIDLFGDVLPPHRSVKWLKRIRRVTRALGRARDTDVQIAAVEAFLERERAGERRANAAGVERLLLRLRQRRDELQPDVVDAMDRLESSGVIDAMRQHLMRVEVAARIESRTGSAPAPESTGADHAPIPAEPVLLDEAREAILLRLEQMLAFERYLREPAHVEELHEMRIAAKYLRYTLEAYGELFAGSLKGPIRVLKRVQAMLGDIHDCDVWAHDLPDFIEREGRRHAEFFGHRRGFKRIEAGVGDFMADRAARRVELHGRFVELWDELTSGGAWANLRGLVLGSDVADKMTSEGGAERESADANER